jgi:hypothetical protein
MTFVLFHDAHNTCRHMSTPEVHPCAFMEIFRHGRHLRLLPQLPHMPRVKAHEIALSIRAAGSNRIYNPSRKFEKAWR